MAESDEFYNDLVAEVLEIVAEFGTTYKVRSPGAIDPDTLKTTVGPERDVAGLISEWEMLQADEVMRMIGRKITTKKVLLLDPVEPILEEDEAFIEGQWTSLNGLITIKPADITLLYMLEVYK